MQEVSLEAIRDNKKITFPVKESNKSRFIGKLRYWWSLSFVAFLLLFVAFPAMTFLQIINRRMKLYPLCVWGSKLWIRASGAEVKVSGQENLEENKSYIFIANHRSYLDTTALFAYGGKKMGLIGKKELLKVPVLGRGMQFIKFRAIDRSNPQKALETMEQVRETVDSGYSFGIFAEGTRAMPGELLPFKKGAFHLALQTGAAIIPVAIKNTDYLMGKKTGVANSGTMEIVLLPPIETKGLTADEDLMDLLTKTRGAIAEELRSEN
ncbi:MAG TPA: lysophospholipid acyltransferase family protein [Pyrinomonadaceae bacterium]|nr:lysophospholipid acyltransferase family protein [Pyrinomonadaceae bacterium]